MNTISRKNSFGRELGGDQGGDQGGGGPSNPTPTFCTLPRDSKACEVRNNATGGMQGSLAYLGLALKECARGNDSVCKV